MLVGEFDARRHQVSAAVEHCGRTAWCRPAFPTAPGCRRRSCSAPCSRPTTRGRRWVPPAPGTRPILTSGRRDLRARHGDAVVAAERQLEAAAHADAVDGGDDRLGRFSTVRDQGMQGRLGQRFRRIEFADVRAAGKHLAGAGDDDGLDRVVGFRLGAAPRRRAVRVARPSPLTGGLFRVMTATLPCTT